MPTLLYAQVGPKRLQADRHHKRFDNQLQLTGHLQKRPSFYLGLSLKSNELNAAEFPCVVKNMNLAVPDYELKWDIIQKNGPNDWDWSGADRLFHWAQVHGKMMRGHTALWEQSVPNWVSNLSGDRIKMELAIQNFVYAVVSRYGHRMVSYDVVNEPISYGASGAYKDSVFWKTLGMDMYKVAYGAAHQARQHSQSKVLLYLNEMNVEGDNVQGSTNKRASFLRLLADLRRTNITVDGVGLQCHFRTDMFPRDLENGIKVFTDMNYQVTLTELDIRIRKGDYSQQTLQRQAEQYAFTYEACLKNLHCVGVVRWGVDDGESWIGKQFDDGFDRATMFADGCKPKEAIMNSVISVLKRY
ncbi:hypothetical protein CBS101457_006265 [Exobasidium rhododendri]|nr:hypothetical protein CBS101457_006265 [Exobasidium rhododendri]